MNNSRQPLYDELSVQPMRYELTYVGFAELRTADDVHSAVDKTDDKTVLVMINSVCGCAAGSARPGVSQALQHSVIPDELYTVFAGQDRDAVDCVRSYIVGEAPSSPAAALFKNGTLLHYLPRFMIENSSAEQIADHLISVFDEHCSRKGPSIDPDKYAQLVQYRACGSTIPLNE